MGSDHINPHSACPRPRIYPKCFHFAGHRLSHWVLNFGLSQAYWVPFMELSVAEVLGHSVCPHFPGGTVSGISFVHFVLLLWFFVCLRVPSWQEHISN